MADRELPAGNVSLLFTDIEGSTRLIEELGESGYVDALAEHRRLLRAAFSAHGGVEVDTQGDAFLYAFADPVEALAAAAQGQEALAPGPVQVRMGVHTGVLQLTGEGYAGRELHKAARIAASGHGGQVVVSAATRALIDGELTELGEHRLKDFDEPVPLFQFGDGRFPPLKTISNTNLPRPASSFVGRGRERDELLALLRNGSRLVTLTGPGGSGKTRLALEVASELVPTFKAGVFWVGLSALRDPTLVTRNDRTDAGGEGRPRRARLRARAPAAARQLRAGGRGGARALAAARGLPPPEAPGHEPGAAADQRRGRVPGAAARRAGGGRALLRAVATRAGRDDRRALPPAGRHAARSRARRRPHPRPHSRADPRPARPATRPAQGRPRRRPAPANPARDDRMVTRPAHRGRAAALRPPRRLRRRLHPRRGRRRLRRRPRRPTVARRQEPRCATRGDRFWMLETIREFAAERLQDQLEAGRIFERHAQWYLRPGEERPRRIARSGRSGVAGTPRRRPGEPPQGDRLGPRPRRAPGGRAGRQPPSTSSPCADSFARRWTTSCMRSRQPGRPRSIRRSFCTGRRSVAFENLGDLRGLRNSGTSSSSSSVAPAETLG